LEKHSKGLKIEVGLNAGDFLLEWKRSALVANYLADFMAYEYPHREMAENLISTVLNELIEAAYRLAVDRSPLQLLLRTEDGHLIIALDHQCQPGLSSTYREFVGQLVQGSDGPLYFQLLEAETRPEPLFNQFGLAMIAHDFSGQITVEDLGTTQLRTTIDLPTKELSA